MDDLAVGEVSHTVGTIRDSGNNRTLLQGKQGKYYSMLSLRQLHSALNAPAKKNVKKKLWLTSRASAFGCP